ncbi:hypothetical protein MFLAVUS_009896 [Mucor flavus]|uniref:Uncharacterized protein n=1 Tax=Mucor flavus TaxID=439312 RepID=A0ABP9ZB68_9FUNG
MPLTSVYTIINLSLIGRVQDFGSCQLNENYGIAATGLNTQHGVNSTGLHNQHGVDSTGLRNQQPGQSNENHTRTELNKIAHIKLNDTNFCGHRDTVDEYHKNAREGSSLSSIKNVPEAFAFLENVLIIHFDDHRFFVTEFEMYAHNRDHTDDCAQES